MKIKNLLKNCFDCDIIIMLNCSDLVTRKAVFYYVQYQKKN